uniref:Myosuppressin-like protein n=1 Tax=Ampulex compressa TaxID=860918 RepID=A0A1W6EW89_AMPCP|nr:myosuppressin-like protein [Ampulex compressa]
MASFVVILLSMMTMTIICGQSYANIPVQCNPGLFEELPPRIRKVCAALNRIYNLGSEMENYIDENDNNLGFYNNLIDSGVKRQDVDHVFLRFGKRR